MPEIKGVLNLDPQGEWVIETADPQHADQSLDPVLEPLKGQPVRVLRQSGHGGREWVVIERVVEVPA